MYVLDGPDGIRSMRAMRRYRDLDYPPPPAGSLKLEASDFYEPPGTALYDWDGAWVVQRCWSDARPGVGFYGTELRKLSESEEVALEVALA